MSYLGEVLLLTPSHDAFWQESHEDDYADGDLVGYSGEY